MFNSLSGRFLVLTVIFVMLAEIMIFVPSVARFREQQLLDAIKRAQIASLVLLADDMISPELERELLENAGVYNVVLRRDSVRELMLDSPKPYPLGGRFDLTDATAWDLIRDAALRLVNPRQETIQVIGTPTEAAGTAIEITMAAYPLRMAMLDYGARILLLSAVISIVTASLLFFAVRRLLVVPIKGVVNYMKNYTTAPEDARRIIMPSAGVSELRDAEEALQMMQTQLTAALRQKERLAQLGGAVAKISHDLRNILTAAQLFADRMEHSDDPRIQRVAPKLVGSISRAVNLCESTLAFGRAEEPPPALVRVPVASIAEEVVESEGLALQGDMVVLENQIAPNLVMRCDPEQLHRILQNLVRNARQAIEASAQPGSVTLMAEEDEAYWRILVSDTGPGLPPKAREYLFTPFQGATRKGGTGLGLTIALELTRGHGGRLELMRSDETGTVFAVSLPKEGEFGKALSA
ncbi:MAG: sensor histidine kinase [Mangrovicoccus sp.]